MDNNAEVYFGADDELSEYESVSRGWRQDVYVFADNEWFQLNVYEPVRLVQDFETEVETIGYYQIDSNMILVVSADKETIVSTILSLYSCGYFQEIKPTEAVDKEKLIRII